MTHFRRERACSTTDNVHEVRVNDIAHSRSKLPRFRILTNSPDSENVLTDSTQPSAPSNTPPSAPVGGVCPAAARARRSCVGSPAPRTTEWLARTAQSPNSAKSVLDSGNSQAHRAKVSLTQKQSSTKRATSMNRIPVVLTSVVLLAQITLAAESVTKHPDLFNVHYASGTWVAVGQSILTSTNTILWNTNLASGVSAAMTDSAYADGVWVVVGWKGTILISTNE